MNALGTAREIIDAMLSDVHSTLLLHVYYIGGIVKRRTHLEQIFVRHNIQTRASATPEGCTGWSVNDKARGIIFEGVRSCGPYASYMY